MEAKPCCIQQDTHSSVEGMGRSDALHEISPDPKDLPCVASLANHFHCRQLWISSEAAHIKQGDF